MTRSTPNHIQALLLITFIMVMVNGVFSVFAKKTILNGYRQLEREEVQQRLQAALDHLETTLSRVSGPEAQSLTLNSQGVLTPNQDLTPLAHQLAANLERRWEVVKERTAEGHLSGPIAIEEKILWVQLFPQPYGRTRILWTSLNQRPVPPHLGDLSYRPMKAGEMPHLFLQLLKPAEDGEPLAQQFLDDDRIIGRALFPDLYGYPHLLLETVLPRSLMQQGKHTLQTLLFWMYLASALVGILLYIIIGRLLTLRKREKRQERQYRTLVDQLEIGAALVDTSGKVLLANPPADRFLRFLGDHPSYSSWLGSGSGTPLETGPVAEALKTGVPQFRELSEDDGSGYEWSLEWRATPLDDRQGCILTFEDTSAQKQVEQRIQELAFQDNLTDLPNRQQFNQQLQLALAGLETTGVPLAIIYLDLDRLQTVNDTLGHASGDRLITMVAERLKAVEEPGEILARLGGGEFAFMAPATNAEMASRVAERLLKAAAHPYKLDNQEVFSTSSIGIVMAPEDGTDGALLTSRAHLALGAAKKQGGNSYHFFSEQMHDQVHERHELEGGLRRALNEDELYLVYQPQIESRTGHIIGFEALARWNHREKGMISPGRFIPVAEDTNLIRPIGEWTLREACRQAKTWQEAGFPATRMAVNLSGYLLQQEEILSYIDQTLTETGLEPRYLEVELTETALIQNAEATKKILAELKTRGLQIAMDDFGTGYSSLSYLQNFSIDRVKIDQSFVRGIGKDTSQATLVVTIIAMARALGLDVIAEGVETRQQLDYLMSHQCDEMQGYYFGKPMTVAQINRLFQDGYGQESVCLYAADSLDVPEEPLK